MHPAFSVIFLTTLIGVGQGLFIALWIGQFYGLTDTNISVSQDFFLVGTVFVLLFMGAGLVASFFHLGRPERAWRSVTQWRTSWLSREVIALPMFMLAAFAYGLALYNGASNSTTMVIGMIGVTMSFVLFYCTGMIYACLTFLREWATPLTIVNFILFGTASGFAFAAFLSTFYTDGLVQIFTTTAIVLTALSFATRYWTLVRNAALKANPKTTTQTAIGVKHPQVQQRSQGQMGGSYNTREFFHHKTAARVKQIKTVFLVLVFPVPLLLLVMGLSTGSTFMLFLAFASQYAGLLAERWYFFVQVNHPQNLYYQTVS